MTHHKDSQSALSKKERIDPDANYAFTGTQVKQLIEVMLLLYGTGQAMDPDERRDYANAMDVMLHDVDERAM